MGSSPQKRRREPERRSSQRKGRSGSARKINSALTDNESPRSKQRRTDQSSSPSSPWPSSGLSDVLSPLGPGSEARSTPLSLSPSPSPSVLADALFAEQQLLERRERMRAAAKRYQTRMAALPLPGPAEQSLEHETVQQFCRRVADFPRPIRFGNGTPTAFQFFSRSGVVEPTAHVEGAEAAAASPAPYDDDACLFQPIQEEPTAEPC